MTSIILKISLLLPKPNTGCFLLPVIFPKAIPNLVYIGFISMEETTKMHVTWNPIGSCNSIRSYFSCQKSPSNYLARQKKRLQRESKQNFAIWYFKHHHTTKSPKQTPTNKSEVRIAYQITTSRTINSCLNLNQRKSFTILFRSFYQGSLGSTQQRR